MFSILGLFQKLPCPERQRCTRPNCLFSHADNVAQIPTVRVPIDVPKLQPIAAPALASPPQPLASSSKLSTQVSKNEGTIPAKRPLSFIRPSAGAAGSPGRVVEPPRKLQRVGNPQTLTAVQTVAYTTDGVPLLRVNAAASQVAVPVRQAMVKNLFEHFKVLYQNILDRNPTLAAEHALRQEQEVYEKVNKLTYRNAVIQCIASIKTRPLPDSVSHPSVGTEVELVKRAEEKKKMDSLRLTSEHLEPYVLSREEMEKWGYIVEIPSGVGGDRPSEEGSIMTCERCGQLFQVKRREEADQCSYHWGRPFLNKANGESRRVYNCCSRTMDEEPCSRGPHVFYEKKPEDLHRRHPFSLTRPARAGGDAALGIVALDCEMIYSTCGMAVARVSVVDAAGKEIFDEFVRLDDGVEVIDFNTRFSGVNEENYKSAVLPLASIRQSLDTFINSDTIIIGHALDNDLKTLRMVHHRCVDTAIMPTFQHRAGPPYRPALRNLVKAYLGKIIQAGGGTVGHSSVEDSVATLDLVRWHILNGQKPKPKQKPPSDLQETTKS